MYAAVGYGGLTPNQILLRLIEDYKQEHKIEEDIFEQKQVAKRFVSKKNATVTVKGYSDMVVHLAKCCNPLPGDDIIGYITRGAGFLCTAQTALTSTTRIFRRTGA